MAASAIMDCEDSVACVDAEDKVLAYANWLGLMKGDLKTSFEKAGRPVDRKLEADRRYTGPDGGEVIVKGRALLWVRNVGHLMTNPAILDADGNEVFEGLMDAMITTLIAMFISGILMCVGVGFILVPIVALASLVLRSAMPESIVPDS